MSDDIELNELTISELSPFTRHVLLKFVVVDKGDSRTVSSRKTGEEHELCDVTVGDSTGTIVCSLWDDNIDKVEVGNTYILKNGYVNVFQSHMRLALGKWGTIEDSDEVIDLDDVDRENDRSAEEVEDPRRSRRSGGFRSGGRERRPYNRRQSFEGKSRY